MRGLALLLIQAYRRWISPYKGFACAHRMHCRGASCSKVGERLIRRHGLRQGLPLLRERLRRCGEIAAQQRQRPLAAQRGDCDLPMIDCDLPSPKGLSVCDCCSSGGCDWPRRDRQAQSRRRLRT